MHIIRNTACQYKFTTCVYIVLNNCHIYSGTSLYNELVGTSEIVHNTGFLITEVE